MCIVTATCTVDCTLNTKLEQEKLLLLALYKVRCKQGVRAVCIDKHGAMLCLCMEHSLQSGDGQPCNYSFFY